MTLRYLSCAVVLSGAIACGGAQPTGPATATHVNVIDATSRELAPDLAGRVDRAEADVRAAAERDDEAAATDHRQRARLWRVALDAEVARISLERDRARVLADIEAIETTRVADEQARAAIEQHIKREQARAIARAEAVRVLLEAESDEARRRGGDPARVESRREASRALIERTSAMLAAAVALGADAATVSSARTAIDTARRKLDGSPAGVTAAHAAFALTQRALGQARNGRPGPDTHERASLLEALATHGWSAELLDEGVVVWLTELFSGNRAELRPGARTLLADLAAILTGHPHGPVHVQATTTGAIAKSIAQRRAQQLKAALVGVDTTRIEVVGAVGVGDQQSTARVILPAYGCNAIANDATLCMQQPAPESTGTVAVP